MPSGSHSPAPTYRRMVLGALVLVVWGAGHGAAADQLAGLSSALLSSDLMPPGLLMAEARAGTARKKVEQDVPANNATVGFALSTMDFHRRMMNEYLCRGYMAEDILERLQRDADTNEVDEEDHTPSRHRESNNNSTRNKSGGKRKGSEVEQSSLQQRRGGNNVSRKTSNHRPNQLLTDEGSSNYRDWLTRSAVLEDIYRRYEHVGDRDEDEGEDRHDDHSRDDDYDGEITGWAMEEPHWPKQDTGRHPEEELGDGYGHHHHEYAEPVIASSGSNSALSLGVRDIFDVALTAIAFLAFGIFILNVFLGILLPSSSTRTVVISNLTLPFRNRAGALDLGPEGKKRERIARWVEEEEPFERVETVEEIAARLALDSLRSAVGSAPAHCLQAALCRGNKQSRSLQGQAKYWLPIWSLGMSWLARRGGGAAGSEPGSSALFSGALENLRAATLGLAGARCKDLFPTC